MAERTHIVRGLMTAPQQIPEDLDLPVLSPTSSQESKAFPPTRSPYLLDWPTPMSNRTVDRTKSDLLRGRTIINLFLPCPSTRTSRVHSSLRANASAAMSMNMSVASSAVKKGETLIDTAMTLNAMHPDVLIVRHATSRRGKTALRKSELLGH